MGFTEKLFGPEIPCGRRGCGRNITDSELAYLEKVKQDGSIMGYRFFHLTSCIENEIISVSIESGKPVYAKYPVVSRGEAVEMLKRLRLERLSIGVAAGGE